MTLEVSRNVKKRFGAATTLSIVERIEQHDDLFRSHREMFLETVLARTLPNVFHEYVNTWPKAKVTCLKWDGTFRFAIEVNYRNWFLSGEFDASKFYTDKAKFCDELDQFVCKMSDEFIAEEQSGRPWWWKVDDKHYTYSAHCKLGDKTYGINTGLGYIKFRGGRWNWFITPSSHRSDWPVKTHKQGVAPSFEEAKAKVEAGWKVEEKHGEETKAASGS